ncbi:MAG TPA: MotA/TolQ/ExbB proton channel family protein [Rhodocyclaceae bacterium]|nr:MotA/TolQ/ExbB proton channel family protein [Rhodocyclaceae bacterium]
MADAGFSHFLAQADAVAQAVLAALLLMSVATWTLILVKLRRNRMAFGERRDFLAAYRTCAAPGVLARQLDQQGLAGACGRLARGGFAAWQRWQRRAATARGAAESVEDLLDRALCRAVAAERTRLEEGLAVLAAVGSTAPFVGLFGTVWGIYHALLAIGVSGQATLDKVAGPVGEALVMTAFGLAVAVPAALAYNAFLRAGRVAMAELEDFAHEFHAFLVTGVPSAAESA